MQGRAPKFTAFFLKKPHDVFFGGKIPRTPRFFDTPRLFGFYWYTPQCFMAPPPIYGGRATRNRKVSPEIREKWGARPTHFDEKWEGARFFGKANTGKRDVF